MRAKEFLKAVNIYCIHPEDKVLIFNPERRQITGIRTVCDGEDCIGKDFLGQAVIIPNQKVYGDFKAHELQQAGENYPPSLIDSVTENLESAKSCLKEGDSVGAMESVDIAIYILNQNPGQE